MCHRLEQPLRHEEARDLIPWLVNERASEEESRRLHLHLALCTDCRQELDAQRRIRLAITRDTRLDSVPGASFQHLWARIEASKSPYANAHQHETSAIPAVKIPAKATRRRPLVQSLVAAVVVEAIGLTLLGGMVWSEAGSRAQTEPYRTLSTLQTPPVKATVRAVFSPNMTLSELQTLLNQVDLQVSSGPTDAGVYSLSPMRAATSGESSALRLRSQPGVRFAEPIDAPTRSR